MSRGNGRKGSEDKAEKGTPWHCSCVFLFVFLENDQPSDFILRSCVLWALKGSVEAYRQILLLNDIWQGEFLPNSV